MSGPKVRITVALDLMFTLGTDPAVEQLKNALAKIQELGKKTNAHAVHVSIQEL